VKELFVTETILALIPSPPQGVWYLGPVPIRAYALCIIAGIIVALWIGQKRYAARGGEREIVLDAAIVAVPTGIIGGRLYHVMTDYDKYFCSTCDPVDALKITNGGLGIWGAVVLGTVSVYAYLRFKKIPFAPFADALAPAGVVGRRTGAAEPAGERASGRRRRTAPVRAFVEVGPATLVPVSSC